MVASLSLSELHNEAGARCSFFKKRFYLFIFREGEGREKEERNIDVRKKPRLVAPGMSRKKHWLVAFGCGDQTPQPGLCPDWESNQ